MLPPGSSTMGTLPLHPPGLRYGDVPQTLSRLHGFQIPTIPWPTEAVTKGPPDAV